MGRSVLSPTQLSVETMSPMSFIVILLVFGSINAELETGEDGSPPTEPTSTDTGFPVIDDDVYNNNNDEASPQKRSACNWKMPKRCLFRDGCRGAHCEKRNRMCRNPCRG